MKKEIALSVGSLLVLASCTEKDARGSVASQDNLNPVSLARESSGLPSSEALKNFIEIGKIAEHPYWRKIYTVEEGDTISRIASRVYPDFNKNQPRYVEILRQANFQDPKENLSIYPEQKLYIPDPERLTYGLGLGEKVMGVSFESAEEVKGENIFRISILGQEMKTPEGKGIKIGQEFIAPNKKGELIRYRLTAYLPGMDDYKIPERIVFEQVNSPSK